MATEREVDKPIIRECKNWLEWAISVLGVADADILNLTTVLGTSTTTSLVGMIGAKTCREVDVPMRRQCQDAMVIAKNLGVLTDTNVAAADTKNGMRTLFNNVDASLSATARDNYSAPFPIGHPQALS